MLQMGTNIMANQVKTPIQNYFEKCCMAIWHLRFLPCVFFRVEREKEKKNRNCDETRFLGVC